MKRALQSMSCAADDLLESHGLAAAQRRPLMQLRATGRAKVTEMARALQADARATTGAIDRLEQTGLCRRNRADADADADARIKIVELTRAGGAAVSASLTVMCQ